MYLKMNMCPGCGTTHISRYCPNCGTQLEKSEDNNKKSLISALIHIENIHKSYLVGKLPVYALRGVSLDIQNGEFLAIMGPSGSGKSTLLHLIGALDTPTEGHILFNNKNLSLANSNELADFRLKHIGFIFQTFYLIPSLSVLENILLPLVIAGKFSKEKQKNVAIETLEKIGLAERKDHFPSELSGGEQQRVAIARAVINNPTLILADEPTGDLDSKNGQIIIDLLKSLNNSGQTICMVTHDLHLASQADRIIHLFDGKVDNSKQGNNDD